MIGVLINNYNNGPWLRACIDSVLAQTLPADEIVVYDDGSTDDSIAILRSYGPRIRLLEGVHDHTRSGRESAAAAIAAAFAASTADHLHLLDGDDVYFPDRLARYAAAWALAPEAVLIHSPSRNLSNDGIPLQDNHWTHKHTRDYWAQTYRLNDCGLYYTTSTLAFRRDYLARRLPLDPRDMSGLAADSCLTTVAPLFGPVLFLPHPYTYWREHRTSLSRIHYLPPVALIRRHNRYYNRWALSQGVRPLITWLNPRLYSEYIRALAPVRLRIAVHRLLGRQPPAALLRG